MMKRNFSTHVNNHGLFVAFGYWIFGKLRYGTVTFWWNRLARDSKSFYDEKREKTKPIWQDLGVFIVLAVTAIAVLLYLCTNKWYANMVVIFLASLVLFDIFVYFSNVLWFDDLQEHKFNPRVWSFRRIVICTFINFGEVILLFAVLFLAAGIPVSFLRALRYSFETAATLSRPDGFPNHALYPCLANSLWALEIIFELFIIVLVVAILAAVGFRREEIAPQKTYEEREPTE
jgi:hypothetical protein